MLWHIGGGTAGKVTFCIFYNEVRFIIGARPSAVEELGAAELSYLSAMWINLGQASEARANIPKYVYFGSHPVKTQDLIF